MAKKEVYTHAQALAIYEQYLTTLGIERKGATMPYTSINGNMFSFLDKAGHLGLRLPEKERNEFMKLYKTQLCVSNGVTMKEYVHVPENVFIDKKAMNKYFKISNSYAQGIKPKK
jgi:hypothetical protein